MPVTLVEEPPAAPQAHDGHVLVSPHKAGGWDVTATIDDRVVAHRHCDDWHRAERARRALQSIVHRYLRHLGSRVFLLLVLVAGAPAAVDAQDPPTPPDPPQQEIERPGLLAEPSAITRAIELTNRFGTVREGGVSNGFYPELGNMVTGAGWISGGPGYRRWLLGDRALVDASAGVSWRAYKMAQVTLDVPRVASRPVAIGTQVRWQDLTQITYFGDGPDAPESNRSQYRLQSTNFIGYSAYTPMSWLSVEGRIGWLANPDVDSPAGTFKRDYPYVRELFPLDPVFGPTDQPDYLHGDLSITADTRDHRGYPSSGGMYRAAWASYSDRDGGRFTFQRYEAEAAHFIPVTANRVVLALHGWLVGTGTADGRVVPFYMLPSLGGANTLRSYSDYRFHDRSLLLLTAESRIAIFTHVDAALFIDAGNVAPRLGDLNLDHRSYGVGIRLHTARTTLLRMDVAHGDEGWGFKFRMNDPFRFGRLSRRTASVPFVP